MGPSDGIRFGSEYVLISTLEYFSIIFNRVTIGIITINIPSTKHRSIIAIYFKNKENRVSIFEFDIYLTVP